MNVEDDTQSSPSSSSNENSISHVPTKRKAGRKKFRETRHPVYRGVRQRNGGKWVCEVREPHKKSRIWLGTFPCPEMAARAHDVAALALRGNFTPLNFADSAWLLPRASSSSARDIQSAAMAAAEAFRPSISVEAPHAEEAEKMEGKDVFMDEEAVFNMPHLLDSMAEGLLIPPPSLQGEFDSDDVDCQVDFPLWSH